jgi:hypothetical protein
MSSFRLINYKTGISFKRNMWVQIDGSILGKIISPHSGFALALNVLIDGQKQVINVKNHKVIEYDGFVGSEYEI